MFAEMSLEDKPLLVKEQSKVAYFSNVYGIRGSDRVKVTNQYFESFLEALLPPIVFFNLNCCESKLSNENFERLLKLSKEEQLLIIESEGLEVNKKDWFDLAVVPNLESRIRH